MLKQIKDQTFELLDKYKGKISKVDYERIIKRINLLYYFSENKNQKVEIDE